MVDVMRPPVSNGHQTKESLASRTNLVSNGSAITDDKAKISRSKWQS